MIAVTARKMLSFYLLALLFVGLISTVPAAAAPKPAGLRVTGVLPNSHGEFYGFVVGIDDSDRRMYYMNRQGPNFYLREYDLRPEIPQQVREKIMGVYADLEVNYYSPYTVALQDRSDQLVILSQTGHGSSLKFIDLKTFKFAGEWDIGTVLPGFVAAGMAVSEEDGRIYMVGSQAVNRYGTQNRGVQKPAQVTLVAAFDATLKPTEPPQLEWVRAVPQCQQVMDTNDVGALLARSENLSALYFACIRAAQHPGESGLVRLWIDKDADQTAANNFPLDFFPVSGSFTVPTEGIVGVAAFDSRRERFFIQSLSPGTPGVWVFDGEVSAWVGFVVSPDNSNWYFGLDSASGHYYQGGYGGPDNRGYIVVSDVSQTPVSQGEVIDGIPMKGFIAVDERTHRLFAEVDLERAGLWKPGEGEQANGFVVIRDETTIAKPQKPVDYDELTSNVKEGPGVATSFSGGVNGYGSRILLVGGYGGVVSATGQRPTVGPFRPGDRGLTAARVPSVDIRSAGASASAQGLVPDANTEGDLDEAGAGAWPWTPASCLDGGGSAQRMQGEGPNSHAVVGCDLEKATAEASSSWGAITASGVSVASSSFEARARRDPKVGSITEAVAQSTGIQVGVPGGGSLSIGRVWARSETVAHGRSKSAEAKYERKIIGIELTDAEGNVVQRIGECGGKEDVTCHDAIAEINRALPMKVNIDLPEPVVTGTPKGAFSGVFLSEGDFIEARTMNNHGSTFEAESASRAVPALQISLYNDSEEKSRVVTQLAAIEANSIYTNTPIEEQDLPDVEMPAPETDVVPPSGGAALPPTDLSSSGAPDSLGTTGGGDLGATDTALTQPVAVAPPVKGVLAFLSRSPGSAVLVAAVWMTFVSAGAAALRRRSLLALLLDGGSSR